MINENISKTLVFLLVLWYNSGMSDRLNLPSFSSLQGPLFDYVEPDSPILGRPASREGCTGAAEAVSGRDYDEARVDQGVGTVYEVRAMNTGVFPDQHHLRERPTVAEPPVSPEELKRGRDIKDCLVLYLRNLELSGITEEGEYLLKIQEFIRKDKERKEKMTLIGVTVSGIDQSKYIKFGESAPVWSDLGLE